MEEKYLIINADGLGFTPGVNQGIVRTFEFGLVTSTSCTPNFGHLSEAGEIQRRFPNVSFGVHFNLSVGPPCASPEKVQSLLGEDNTFVGAALLGRIIRGEAKIAEMEIELEAQAAILADQGVRISHWDGHQNKHLWPAYFEAGSRVARRFGIGGIRSHRRLLFGRDGPETLSSLMHYYALHPSRIATHLGGWLRTGMAEKRGFCAADRLITPGYTDESHKSQLRFWTTLSRNTPIGVSEVYCHPGYPDDLLRANAKYVEKRAEEVEVLTSVALRDEFTENGIKLINFFDLAKLRN